MILSLVLALLLQQTPAATPAAPANDHEYIDLMKINLMDVYNKYISEHQVSDAQKKELKELFQFRDFVGKTLDGQSVNFHQPKEKGYKPAKVLLMTYIADWCKNCNYEAPYLRDIYNKYHSKGLEIISRAEYTDVEKLKEMFARHHTPYPVIIGSTSAYSERQKIRMETFQYLLRNTLGDKRTWGTPFTIIVFNGDLNNPYIAMGEIKTDQLDPLLEKTFGTSK